MSGDDQQKIHKYHALDVQALFSQQQASRAVKDVDVVNIMLGDTIFDSNFAIILEDIVAQEIIYWAW